MSSRIAHGSIKNEKRANLEGLGVIIEACYDVCVRPPVDPLSFVLECAYRDYHSDYCRQRDPLTLVHDYSSPEDKEVVGFITALLSYGNVPTILRNARKVLLALGPTPAMAIRCRKPFNLSDFRHRFTTGEDLEIVLHWLRAALAADGSLEAFFLASGSDTLPLVRLSNFVRRFTGQPLPPRLRRVANQRERALRHLIPDPRRGSACKRLNLFLRWMVRPADGIDLGLWTKVEPASLILPLDTHVLQTIRTLGWTAARQASWRVAEEATERLRGVCARDPIRFDFSLCHLSMEGDRILRYKPLPKAHAKVE